MTPNKHKTKGMLAVLLVSLCLPCTNVFPMNDVDKVVGYDLVPIDSLDHQLYLLYEKIEIVLRPGIIDVQKTYSIQNRGNAGYLSFGITCQTTILNDPSFTCTRVFENDSTLDGIGHYGAIFDKGTWAASRVIALETLQDCQRNVDGNVCGYYWQKYELYFSKNSVKEISTNFSIPIKPTPILIYSALNQVGIYNLKFWANETVPLIEIFFSIDGHSLSLDDLRPTGNYAKYSEEPDSVRDGSVMWLIKDYRPIKTTDEYGKSLIHPNSIDSENLIKMLESK